MTREEAISLIKSAQLMLINPTTNEPVSDLYAALEMAIKALSQEHKSGKWIDRQFQSKIDGEIRNGWECSECGERFFRYDLVNTDEFIPKYCPYCGVEMVEPQESEG